VRGKIIPLDEEDAEPPPRRVARDAGAVDAAADNEKIDNVAVTAHFAEPSPQRFMAVSTD
jgi:hypothetical protein